MTRGKELSIRQPVDVGMMVLLGFTSVTMHDELQHHAHLGLTFLTSVFQNTPRPSGRSSREN